MLSCGDEGPTGPDPVELEVLVVRGDEQASEPGATLPVPLEVRVQRRGNGAPIEGVKVRWEILLGTGASLEPTLSGSDSLGSAKIRLTLGPSLGVYRVQAFIRGMESAPALFSAEAVQVPSVAQLPSDPVRSGDTILVLGSGFSSKPDQNVVSFSRVRGRVVSASSSELRVEVPACLPPREYEVRVRIGSLSTDPVPLEVNGSPDSLILEPGEDRVLDTSEGLHCFHLPAEEGAYYLVVPHSTGTLGGAEFEFGLVALTSDGLPPTLVSPRTSFSLSPGVAEVAGREILGLDPRREADLGLQDRWDERIRSLERKLIKELGPLDAPSLPEISAAAKALDLPEVGETREFRVLNNREQFDRVTARLAHISSRSLLYVDVEAPSGGFTEDELVSLASEFEDPVHTTITEVFGEESDLDGNGRVIILLTVAVNKLTESDADGFVGGFFYGLDLLPGRKGSNGGEIFYAVVPDPQGSVGPVINRYTALTRIPAILAHEFEHMVHFNQRMLLRGAENTEALWLTEAMAQMAEDLVGEAFEDAGMTGKANEYRTGNWLRARRFLENPSQVSVLASFPPGTLAERGAGWLFLKHVVGRGGQEDLLGALASSTRTGVENFTDAAGMSWKSLVADWAGSLYLDGTSFPVRPELRVSGVNLRLVLSEPGGRYPLRPPFFGDGSDLFLGTLWSSAPNYFIINPISEGGVALSSGGPLGGAPEAGLGLQVLVVRLL